MKVKKRRKVRKMSKKYKPVLTSKIFNKPDKVHQYVRLIKFTGKPLCLMCKYQWYENIFEHKRVNVWNRKIKQTNHGCAYCDVAICKKYFDFLTQL